MKNCWLLLMIVVLLVAACGSEGNERDTSPLVQPTSPISSPQSPGDTDEAIVAALQSLVAEQLSIRLAELSLVSAERVTWRDASLGCPQEGMMYAQVLTPGWRVVFADASGEEHDVHTSEKADTFVICQQASAQPTEFQELAAVEAAVKVVADRRNVALEDVSVVKVESVEWRNSCLGCQVPGQMCLMVLTPGYLVVLESEGETYEIHTDRTGKVAIFCENPSAPPERTDS